MSRVSDPRAERKETEFHHALAVPGDVRESLVFVRASRGRDRGFRCEAGHGVDAASDGAESEGGAHCTVSTRFALRSSRKLPRFFPKQHFRECHFFGHARGVALQGQRRCLYEQRVMAVPSTHGAFTIDGVHTEVLVTDYGQRVLVLVTQIGKLGTMYITKASSDGPGTSADVSQPPEMRVLVGRHDDEILYAAARRIAHVVRGKGLDKEVLVSLGLPPKLGVEQLRGVVRCATEFACEALNL